MNSPSPVPVPVPDVLGVGSMFQRCARSLFQRCARSLFLSMVQSAPASWHFAAELTYLSHTAHVPREAGS
jgi:hypothetical protein